MILKKNDRIKLAITDMTIKGEGVGKYDGLAFFVKDAVIGDEVLAVVTKLKKGYGYAKVLEVLRPSPDRVQPVCPVALRCGGCQLMQMSYDAQLRFKERLVRNDLERLGGQKDFTFYPIISMIENAGYHETSQPMHFRNKLQFPVGWDSQGHVITGFYAGRTHHIVSTPQCFVSPEVNDRIMECIREFLEKNRISTYNEETGQGLVRHILVRNGFRTGQIMVCLVINGDSLQTEKNGQRKSTKRRELSYTENTVACLTDEEQDLVSALVHWDLSADSVPGEGNWTITSICLNSNQARSNVILGDKIRCLYGAPYIEETIVGIAEAGEIRPLTFRINPLSFFQTNPVQTAKLYGKVLEFASLTGNETVWDLYCGTGSISLFLAQKARKVYGVEIVPEAIQDAKDNAVRNGIFNVEFYCGKSEEVFLQQMEVVEETAKEASKLPKGTEALEKGTSTPGQDTTDQNESESIQECSYAGQMVVVLDPPRKGCERELLEAIRQVSPEKIVYVSCDPATLARDVAILCDREGDGLCGSGYVLEKVQTVDMFPHTVHVECVVLLSRQQKHCPG